MQITKTKEAFQSSLLLGALLQAGVRKAPQQQIHYRDQLSFTYRQLNTRVQQLAHVLTAQGVTVGQTVAVMDWDSHRYLECFFAVPMLGAVLHTINVRLSPEQILYTINHAEDDVLLVNSEFLPVLESIWSRIETVKQVIVLTDEPASTTSIATVGEYEALLAEAPANFVFPEFDENTRATTFYTTGTTGLPKGVYFSHRQLVMHTLAMRSATAGVGHGRFNGDDVYMPMTPMFHVHAWGAPLVATLLGVKQVYPGRYEPATLLQLIEQHQVTFTHCVPTILQMLLSAAGEQQFKGLKMIIGGAALTESLAVRALQQGIDVFTGYGMSETCPILTLSYLQPHMQSWSLEEQAVIRCKTGVPIDFVSLRIVDEQMQDVPHDGQAQGEIVVRSPWLTQSYLKDEEGSKQLWAGGWLHTGDLAVIDAQGYVKITDRIKDVIKTGGEWVSSLEVENILLRHPQIQECAVIGVPDAKWGERPLAVLVGAEQRPEGTELVAFMQTYVEKGLLSKYGIPDRFIWAAEIPKTSVGKLNKKLMREQYI
ncbi:MAG: fatty acid--CoA ligase [Pseudomonas sp.]|jgi:fatty-acyl-CoA synthase|nr:fatty acid--CoA ligase [Pseudomonas sp.]MDD2223313.1 fatty acid--CoA ligase [Pseudomonas sp.]MDY0415226.1 fatty acid--CoA ligase [Pseudomonas sp.]